MAEESNSAPGVNNPEAIAELFQTFIDGVAQLEGLPEAAGCDDPEGLFVITLALNSPGKFAMLSNLRPGVALLLMTHYLMLTNGVDFESMALSASGIDPSKMN